ncbi:MAG: CHAT domain-containing protein [Betaproteobacteria bacterium]|nr:CHAT domain-containing protein [Betaproteobacteria bacterium]
MPEKTIIGLALALWVMLSWSPPLAAQNGPKPTAMAPEEQELVRKLDQVIARDGPSSDAAQSAREDLIQHFRRQFRAADTIPLLQANLEAVLAGHGANSRAAAELRVELGSTLNSVGRSTEARKHLEPAHEFYRQRLGENHPRTAGVLFQLGRAFLSSGQHEKAAEMFERVVKVRQVRFGLNHPQTAVAEHRLGQALWKMGRFAEGEKLLKDALFTLGRAKGEENLHYNTALSELGDLYRASGRLNEAEELLQKALAEQLKSIGPQHPSTIQTFDNLANTLADQRRYLEAEKFARQGLELSTRSLGQESQKSINLAALLASIYSAQGKPEQAESLLRDARQRLLARYGAEAAPVAGMGIRLGGVLIRLKKYDEAKTLLSSALRVYETTAPHHPGRYAAHRDLGQVLLRTGDATQAAHHLSRAIALYSESRGAAAPAPILAAMGEALEQQGKTREAVATYRQAMQGAVGFLAQSRTQSPEARAQQEESVRGMFSRYLGLMLKAQRDRVEVGVNPVEESFVVGENLRNRSLQQAMLRMGARAAVRDARLADLVRKEQDLRILVGSVEQDIVSAVGTGQAVEERETAKTLVQKRRQMEQELRRLGSEIADRFPDYGRLTNPAPATISETMALLGNDEVLLSYLVQKNRSLLWVVRPGGYRLHVVALGEEELEKKVKQLRRALDVSVGRLGDIPSFNVALARELHKLLVEVAGPEIAGARHLVVVHHGALLSLPFAALVTADTAQPQPGGVPFSEYRGVPWLTRSHSVSVLPSATAFVTLRKFAKHRDAQQPFIGFGNPRFDGAPAGRPAEILQRSLKDSRELRSLPPLPETAEELKTIATALGADPARSVILGAEASEPAVKGAPLDRFRVVAFATHGLIAGDLEELVEPALALATPATPTPENDGLLTMSEVLGLRMNADWVVLSACNTAASDGSLASEGLTGLAQAFFYAGSRALLVSLWAVETTSTRRLTTALFAASRDNPALARAEALSRARMEMIQGPGPMRDGKELFSYAHPFFWAPFILVGEGGKD